MINLEEPISSGYPAHIGLILLPGGTRQGGQHNQDKPGGTRQGGQHNQDKPGGTSQGGQHNQDKFVPPSVRLSVCLSVCL